jgi:hypothetical protein
MRSAAPVGPECSGKSKYASSNLTLERSKGFIGGKLSKTAQTIPDWAAKVFGKELHAAKQRE